VVTSEVYSLVTCNARCFGGTYLLSLQSRNKSQARNRYETGCSLLKMEAQLSSACFLLPLVSCLAYFSILKIQVICSSETSGPLRIRWHYDPEIQIIQSNVFINITIFELFNTVKISW
jgi:hypothetical protein